MSETDFLADIEHRRVIALAFSDHDLAAHWHRIHYLAHRFDRFVVRVFSVTLAHSLSRSDCRAFHNAKEVEPKLVLHFAFLHMSPPRDLYEKENIQLGMSGFLLRSDLYQPL